MKDVKYLLLTLIIHHRVVFQLEVVKFMLILSIHYVELTEEYTKILQSWRTAKKFKLLPIIFSLFLVLVITFFT